MLIALWWTVDAKLIVMICSRVSEGDEAAVCTVLYCTVLYCTVLYCTVLYCTALYCTVLYCTVLYCTVLVCLTWITRMRLQSACFSREHRVFRLHPSLSREEMKNINYILDIFNYNCLETLRVRTAGSRAPVADAAWERGRCGRAGGWRAAGSTRPGRASTGPGPTRWARPPGSVEGGGGGPESRASNEGPHKGL